MEQPIEILSIKSIQNLLIEIQGITVLVDRDVACLYGVETRDINQAVKNNPEKFPSGYIIQLEKEQKKELVENFHRFEKLKHSSVNPKVFTEKGLYMLATILKSSQATQATFFIIETFAKIRELASTVKELQEVANQEQQEHLMQRSGEIIAELLDNSLETSETETSIELNFAVLKFKHRITKKK